MLQSLHFKEISHERHVHNKCIGNIVVCIHVENEKKSKRQNTQKRDIWNFLNSASSWKNIAIHRFDPDALKMKFRNFKIG